MRARFGMMLALSIVAACASASAQGRYTWGIVTNERGIALVYGVPHSDRTRHALICHGGTLDLVYSDDADGRTRYGTSLPTTILLDLGGWREALTATATFDEGGSPGIVARVPEPTVLLRRLRTASHVRTTDRWGGTVADPRPSIALTRRFTHECGFLLEGQAR